MTYKLRRTLFFVLFVFILFILVLGSISLYKQIDYWKYDINYYLHADQVEQYRPIVEKYAIQYEVEDYIDTLLGIMMQESSGKGQDPMQSSESLCGSIGCIDDPERSIEQGVAYFKQVLDAAGEDLKLAIQSYNFGIGFVYYAEEQAESYSEALAIQFSQKMYAEASDPSLYTCLRKEAKEYNACYGDIYYVRDVLGYQKIFHTKRVQKGFEIIKKNL